MDNDRLLSNGLHDNSNKQELMKPIKSVLH